MNRLNPEKLTVEYREGITPTEPIIPRHYTLTHSDKTAELFLTIGPEYAYDKINIMRDEVLGEWVQNETGYLYYAYVIVDGQCPTETAIRDMVFRRELPLALEAIRYGDRAFFEAHPELNHSPIIITFMSANPNYYKIEYWGNFSDYDLQRSTAPEKIFLLDTKRGDVTGDGIPDQVSLYGNKPEPANGAFVNNIIIVIEDGSTHQTTTIVPASNSGYSARLFLGDFTKDKIDDIKLSIDSGGSGGYGIFYIYSFVNANLREIFDFNRYNNEYQYRVDYADNYRVNVACITLNKLFVLDISTKGYEYLSQYYDENGKLKQPIQGEVLAIGALFPIVNDEKNNGYDLIALQRIIGTTNSDTLGYIENWLSWDRDKFVSTRMMAAVPGTELIAPYS